MTRDADWLRKLVEAYFDPSLHVDLPLDNDDPRIVDEHRGGAVISQVLDLSHYDPQACWRFIEIAATLPLSPDQLGLLGAGIFEDLMDEHGATFIERVENEILHVANLQVIVDHAWTMSMQPEIAERIHAMQSESVGEDNGKRREWWLTRGQ